MFFDEVLMSIASSTISEDDHSYDTILTIRFKMKDKIQIRSKFLYTL